MNEPEPLTPPECDLRNMPSMLLDVQRLRDSDLVLDRNMEVVGFALLCWAASWHQVPAGSLPDDEKKLAAMLGFGRDARAFRRIREAGGLRGWIKCSDGRLYHPVVCEKAIEAVEARKRQIARTEAARTARHKPKPVAAPAAQDAAEPKSAQTLAEVQPESDQSSAARNAQVIDFPKTATSVTGSNLSEVKIKVLDSQGSLGEAQAPAPDIASDPQYVVWSLGVAIVRAMTGKSPVQSRSLVGKLLRNVRDDCPKLMLILQRAQEARPGNPVEWLIAATGGRHEPHRLSQAEKLEQMLRQDAGTQPVTVDAECWSVSPKAIGGSR